MTHILVTYEINVPKIEEEDSDIEEGVNAFMY
jgi:hypothetical protein